MSKKGVLSDETGKLSFFFVLNGFICFAAIYTNTKSIKLTSSNLIKKLDVLNVAHKHKVPTEVALSTDWDNIVYKTPRIRKKLD